MPLSYGVVHDMPQMSCCAGLDWEQYFETVHLQQHISHMTAAKLQLRCVKGPEQLAHRCLGQHVTQACEYSLQDKVANVNKSCSLIYMKTPD